MPLSVRAELNHAERHRRAGKKIFVRTARERPMNMPGSDEGIYVRCVSTEAVRGCRRYQAYDHGQSAESTCS
jgi:hypothetical protein